MPNNVMPTAVTEFIPELGTDSIWVGSDMNQCLTDTLDEIETAINGKANASHTHSGYADANHTHTEYASATHAHSYNDLSDKPTIPAAYTHPASHPASMITGLSGVATSGSYNDLSDKPTIPTIPASLPANGGNSDTVDGKHATDFATANHSHSNYASTSHTHSASDITGLPSSVDAYSKTESDGRYATAAHTHNPVAVGGIPVANASGDGTTYTATVDGITALTAGQLLVFIPSTTSSTTIPKFNLNDLGAKNLKQKISMNTTATIGAKNTTWLVANKPILIMYDGLQWTYLTGRATASDIYGSVAIANGGTGADNAADALTNLGAASLTYVQGLEARIAALEA